MATPNQSSSDESKTISEILISELPRERGWETDDEDIYLLNGFWNPTWVIHGLLALQQHFKPHPNDVLLASFPKSGTTWLKALLFSIVNRATYNHDDMMHPLLNSNPHDLVPWLEPYAFTNRTNLRPPQSFLFHTHLAYSSLPEQIRSSSCRIVYVFRDPKDVLVSYWHFHFFQPILPRKGEIGDSKNHLSEEMREILDQIRDGKFNEVGLTTFVPLVKTE
nr:flavonol sulfotransferase-like [Ipomoea batatas]